MSIFDQISREVHERMAGLVNTAGAALTQGSSTQQFDPRDTNRDGVVSEAEAAAYVRDYLSSVSPAERDALLQDYVGGLSQEQRREMGDAIVRSPATPVQTVNANDKADLANAITRTAQAQTEGGSNPLEAVFAKGGALDNPLVKAGLVGLAAAIGNKMLRGEGNRGKDHR